MIRHTKKFIKIGFTLTLLLAGADAMAGMGGGTITYSPFAQSIPTLSESMLVLLAFLFSVLAFRALRAYPGGKPLASLLAVGVLALAAASGDKLIQSAQAIILAFDNPNGGSVIINGTGEFPIQNTSGLPQQVISVTPNFANSAFPTTGSPQCTAGLVVQSNGTCYVNFGFLN